MDMVGRGIIAGFLATLALSVVFDPMATLARMADVFPPTFAWFIHFLVGSFIWGASFAAVERFLPGPSWLRGIVFGFGAWLIVMVAIMPLTRGGLFALALGLAAPAAMLVLHLIYGALLGGIYGFLDPDGARTSAADDHHESDDHHLHPLPR
jgi:hypothetical protein